MLRRLLAACCALGLVTAFAVAADEKKDDTKKMSVRVFGLSIYKPKPEDRTRGFYFGPSTTVQAVISVPDKAILTLDQKASKLTSFTDDKKTNLYKTVAFGFSQPWVSPYYSPLSKDRKSIAVNFQGNQAPATGANKILIKGSVAVICGKDEKTAEKKDLEFKKGTKAKFGPLELEITTPYPGAPNLTFVFTSDKPIIKDVKFTDPDGKAVNASTGFGGIAPPGGKIRTVYYLNTPFGKKPEKLEKVTIKLTYYDKTETVKVPIDLSTGIGL
jgi:hypothetical protein